MLSYAKPNNEIDVLLTPNLYPDSDFWPQSPRVHRSSKHSSVKIVEIKYTVFWLVRTNKQTDKLFSRINRCITLSFRKGNDWLNLTMLRFEKRIGLLLNVHGWLKKMLHMFNCIAPHNLPHQFVDESHVLTEIKAANVQYLIKLYLVYCTW